LEQTVLTYFDPYDLNLARRQQEVRNAVQRLVTEGLLAEESAGRYRITPMVEVVLSTEKLAELDQWLREQNEATA
jgi:predicted transcriptional regulator